VRLPNLSRYCNAKPLFFPTVDEKVPEFAIPEGEIDNEIARYYKR